MDPEEYKAVKIAFNEVNNLRREMLDRSCRDLTEETQLYVYFKFILSLIITFHNQLFFFFTRQKKYNFVIFMDNVFYLVKQYG